MNEDNKTYNLTKADIQYIVDKTANDLFSSLAHKGVMIDTDGIVTARITLYINDDVLMFHHTLLTRVSVKTEEYRFPENPDEIVDSIGFRKNKKGW